jgi:FMN phosphatase YigB (HAD superfamily)
MILTLLLDLDDTLLDANMDNFIPAYFQSLAKHLEDRVRPDILLPALRAGTQRMLANQDPRSTLEEVFDAEFYPRIEIAKDQLRDAINDFYDNFFPRLESLTKRRPGVSEFVEWALAQTVNVSVATDPLFPIKATYERIRWAGLDPERFELVSTYETFHFSKSHPAFFAEFLGRLGWPEGSALMVGNDVDRDIRPAQKLGLKSYQLDGRSGSRPDAEGQLQGDFGDLRSWLESADPATLEASFTSIDSILAVLLSTPAVLQSLLSGLDREVLSHEPTRDEWALIEVLCHLRDTELEIHQQQLTTLLNNSDPFVPRPDSTVWAKQRKYLNEDGPRALREFTSARLDNLSQLKDLDAAIWARKARHAIFGPTNFREVVGFMADHDRLHIQQIWDILNAL